MALKISTREATIKTLGVEIKAMKIGPKQVTQSLFRQMEASPLLVGDRAPALVGVPWGYVNYQWKGDGTTELGRWKHFVFQHGELLRRCPILMDRSGDWSRFDPSNVGLPSEYRSACRRIGSFLADRLVAKMALGRVQKCKEYWNSHTDHLSANFGTHCRRFQEDCRRISMAEGGDDLRALYCLRNDQYGYYDQKAISAARFDAACRVYHYVRDGEDDGPDDFGDDEFEAVIRLCSAGIAEQETSVARWCRAYDVLLDSLDGLDQLFIAV